jgi:hypothetical protein
MSSEAWFSAVIKKAGINPYVDVPDEVRAMVGGKGFIPVRVSIDGFAARSTLVPVRDGQHRLYVNTAMRTGAGVGIGDTAEFSIEYDSEPRIVPVPMEFDAVLRGNAEIASAWARLQHSRQQEILRYLNSLQTPEARARNIEKVIRILQDPEGHPRKAAGDKTSKDGL